MEHQPKQRSENPEYQQLGQNVERHHQYFHFGPWTFDIDRAQAILEKQPRQRHRLMVNTWARFYGLAESPAPDMVPLFGPGPEFNREYALTTDLSEPVIVGTVHSAESGDFPLLLDGTHRLYRAYVEGVESLPAYLLNVDETLDIQGDACRR